MKYYMISLKEEYFRRMTSERKSFEFRRTFARYLEEPFLCAIYISSPVQAVGGIVEFGKPIKGTTDELLELARRANYQFTDAVRDYFRGKESGYALPVKNVRIFKKSISLRELRKACPGFSPPQSFYCLENEQFSKLRGYINDHES